MNIFQKSSCVILPVLLFGIIAFSPATANKKRQQDNHAPIVKILSPKNQVSFTGPAQVSYSISVSDKEDGDSKYDEINTKEVLLQADFVGDAAKAQSAVSRENIADATGLKIIRSSNCFNCHDFTGKLIGPSFYDITKKYPATTANILLLAKRIKEGATGVWGKVTMPTHPELTAEQCQTIIKWILQNTANTNTNYYIGTEGNITLQQKGAYILTASYLDLGSKTDSTKRMEGIDRVIIYVK